MLLACYMSVKRMLMESTCMSAVCIFVMYEKHQVIHELLQEEKRIQTDGPQALLKKVDLDHLLDFVHGEKLG